jgi:2-hydroxychromene-2-carboxylate isomerase
MPKPIDFWFYIGSTYTYLSVKRLARVAAGEGVSVTWRPFDVRARIAEVGNTPFRGKPLKMNYMWRDIGRRAQKYGLEPTLPAPYPLGDSVQTNLVAVVAEQEGWCPDYAQAVFTRWFEAGRPANDPDVIRDSITASGQDPERVLAKAAEAETAARYEANTAKAAELGIFGSPNFVVDGELFWGDDRLEDAISWAKHDRVTA